MVSPGAEEKRMDTFYLVDTELQFRKTLKILKMDRW
jgi:hypothetical protein